MAGRRQAIIWTNAGILLIGPLGTNFSEILIEIHIFSFFQENAFEYVVWKKVAILTRPQCAKDAAILWFAALSASDEAFASVHYSCLFSKVTALKLSEGTLRSTQTH